MGENAHPFELSEPLKRQSVYMFVSLMEGMGNKETS